MPSAPLSSARLIAAPAAANGEWVVGVAVALAPNTITYWRDPGEAGVPPRFDFSGSTNVSSTAVFFPAPRRIREGDIDAIGYRDAVVFPVRVTLADKAAPAQVQLVLDYATCERICVPARAELSLRLPAPAEATDAAQVRRAEDAVPRILEADAARAAAAVTVEGGTGPTSWRVVPTTVDAETDLFAEGPDGFFLSTRREGNAFQVRVEEHPANRPVPDRVRFTLVDRTSAVEFSPPVSR